MSSDDVDVLDRRTAEGRDRLEGLVAELDRRRHLVARTRKVLASRPALMAGGALVLLAAATGITLLVVRQTGRRRRRERSLAGRTRRLSSALSRMTRHPERVASRDPTMTGKLITAVASTVLTTLVKRSLTRPAGQSSGVTTHQARA
jgi:hypothetical protein